MESHTLSDFLKIGNFCQVIAQHYGLRPTESATLSHKQLQYQLLHGKIRHNILKADDIMSTNGSKRVLQSCARRMTSYMQQIQMLEVDLLRNCEIETERTLIMRNISELDDEVIDTVDNIQEYLEEHIGTKMTPATTKSNLIYYNPIQPLFKSTNEFEHKPDCEDHFIVKMMQKYEHSKWKMDDFPAVVNLTSTGENFGVDSNNADTDLAVPQYESGTSSTSSDILVMDDRVDDWPEHDICTYTTVDQLSDKDDSLSVDDSCVNRMIVEQPLIMDANDDSVNDRTEIMQPFRHFGYIDNVVDIGISSVNCKMSEEQLDVMDTDASLRVADIMLMTSRYDIETGHIVGDGDDSRSKNVIKPGCNSVVLGVNFVGFGDADRDSLPVQNNDGDRYGVSVPDNDGDRYNVFAENDGNGRYNCASDSDDVGRYCTDRDTGDGDMVHHNCGRDDCIGFNNSVSVCNVDTSIDINYGLVNLPIEPDDDDGYCSNNTDDYIAGDIVNAEPYPNTFADSNMSLEMNHTQTMIERNNIPKVNGKLAEWIKVPATIATNEPPNCDNIESEPAKLNIGRMKKPYKPQLIPDLLVPIVNPEKAKLLDGTYSIISKDCGEFETMPHYNDPPDMKYTMMERCVNVSECREYESSIYMSHFSDPPNESKLLNGLIDMVETNFKHNITGDHLNAEVDNDQRIDDYGMMPKYIQYKPQLRNHATMKLKKSTTSSIRNVTDLTLPHYNDPRRR